MDTKITENRTEISKKHFFKEGERIKIEDKHAIYEMRDPKELAIDVDFGYVRYDTVLKLVDRYCPNGALAHLDLGCGLGYFMGKMAQRKFKTSGVDISKSFLDIAKEKFKYWGLSYVELIEGDLQKRINLSCDSYKVITSTDVIEHIEEPKSFLKEVYRLLSSDGKVFICTNNLLSLWGLEKFINERIFSAQGFHPIDKWFTYLSMKRIIEDCGFRIVEMRGAYFLPFSKFKLPLYITGIYKKRYEIDCWLSRSILKYFARDIIFVLEKASERI